MLTCAIDIVDGPGAMSRGDVGSELDDVSPSSTVSEEIVSSVASLSMSPNVVRAAAVERRASATEERDMGWSSSMMSMRLRRFGVPQPALQLLHETRFRGSSQCPLRLCRSALRPRRHRRARGASGRCTGRAWHSARMRHQHPRTVRIPNRSRPPAQALDPARRSRRPAFRRRFLPWDQGLTVAPSTPVGPNLEQQNTASRIKRRPLAARTAARSTRASPSSPTNDSETQTCLALPAEFYCYASSSAETKSGARLRPLHPPPPPPKKNRIERGTSGRLNTAHCYCYILHVRRPPFCC
eukprot:scaffold4535_cov138-Isochrysis_galbana.AAC.2